MVYSFIVYNKKRFEYSYFFNFFKNMAGDRNNGRNTKKS